MSLDYVHIFILHMYDFNKNKTNLHILNTKFCMECKLIKGHILLCICNVEENATLFACFHIRYDFFI